jgi:hypothetical protein
MSDQAKAIVRLLEVLSILIIIASAAIIAVPKYADLRRRDLAARVLADVDVVRAAVYAFYSDSAYFPAESPTEIIPDPLVLYLPRGFSAVRSYGTLAYKNWPVKAPQQDTAAARRDTAATRVIGAIVTTRDPRVGATAAALSPTVAHFSMGNKFTFVFFGS